MQRDTAVKITVAALLVGAYLVGLAIGRHAATAQKAEVVRETVVVKRDTVTVTAPIAQETRQTGTRGYVVARREATERGEMREDREQTTQTDSVEVELPIIARHYADSTYEAWVSGPVDPRLDSIRVYRQRVEVTRIEKRRDTRRWHIGISGGYGYTPHGFQPYIGVGLTYSIISF